MFATDTNALTVLVPLDGSALALQAIPYASALAGANGKIILTTVIDVPEANRDERGWTIPITDQDQDRAVARAAEYLDDVAAQWLNGGGSGHVVVSVGDPAQEILRIAREEEADVIAIGSHGRGALGRLRFGSVADRLTRASEVPVLVVRPMDSQPDIDKGRIRRFVVALDGSERARKALDVVTRIASQTGDHVHLITVIPGPDVIAVPMPWMGPAVVDYDMGETVLSLERKAVDDLTALADEMNAKGIDTDFTVAVGDPFEEIDRVAYPQDVIVLTSHGRGGLERWALGSLAEKLVRHARAPVLIVNARTAVEQADEE